jgi:hypothetical protein
MILVKCRGTRPKLLFGQASTKIVLQCRTGKAGKGSSATMVIAQEGSPARIISAAVIPVIAFPILTTMHSTELLGVYGSASSALISHSLISPFIQHRMVFCRIGKYMHA